MTPEQFFSPTNYKRYLLTKSLGEQLEKYHQMGCYLYQDNTLYVEWSPVIATEFYSEEEGKGICKRNVGVWTCVAYRVGNCTCSLIDISWDDKPHLPTKKEMLKMFQELRVIHPKDIKKFKVK
jgi:hypothetical protein